MSIVYLMLGSNMGDRISNIQTAAKFLADRSDIEVLNSTTFYETEPWGNKKQNWFVNAAIIISTSYYPEELLNICLRVENQLGRKRSEESGYNDRTIDIDILFYDDKIIDEHSNGIELTIPHPHVHERAFVLVPLLEVAPAYVHPVLKKSISDIYDDIDDPEAVVLYGTRF